MQEIAEGVVASTEFRRVTVGAIATGGGIVCVDVPPFPREARLWRSMLLERFRQPIRLIVLTDAHRDRLLGLHWFEEAHIVAHDATFALMKALPNSFVDQAADQLSRTSDERSTFSSVRLHYPHVTFSERLTAYVHDIPFTLMSMPGPTPGNIWLHLPRERVVFTGDSVVVGQPPYMAHARSKAWLTSLTLLRRPRFSADVIVPGRGPLTDKQSTAPLSDFLRYVRRRVYRLHHAGRPRTDILTLIPPVLEHLDIPSEEIDEVARRIKTGLESIYDEFSTRSEEQDDLPELD